MTASSTLLKEVIENVSPYSNVLYTVDERDALSLVDGLLRLQCLSTNSKSVT